MRCLRQRRTKNDERSSTLDFAFYQTYDPVGLFGNAGEGGERQVCEAYAEELERQRLRFEAELLAANDETIEPLRREAS